MSTKHLEKYLYDCNKKRKKPSSSSSGDQRVFRFKTFGEQGFPTEFNGPFWKNVKQLLEFGQLLDTGSNLLLGADYDNDNNNNNNNNGSSLISCWSFRLQVHRHRPETTVFLFVIEEPFHHSSSTYNIHPPCNHCRCVGWGHHMICNINYHFVVPSKETAAMIAASCLSYRQEGGGSYYDTTRPILRGASTVESNSNFLELEGHTMHGVFHCNGFGHLLCVNGMEMGSDLTGHQIMDFWDRLCTNLRARKVSLNDISLKKGMGLRLLHGAAYGKHWFSHWGYQFTRGTFGVTETMYKKAIQAIQNIPLYHLLHHLLATPPPSSPDPSYIPHVFTKYQTLSNNSLITLGDLFRFMLELKSRLPREPSCNIDSFNPGILLESSCRWSPRRVEMATRVIVDSLRRAASKWVSRQEVRDAARAYIGDTGLLDFVLKSLGNHVVGNYLVRRSLNPVTKVLEYCLEDLSAGSYHYGGRNNSTMSPVVVSSSNNNNNRGRRDGSSGSFALNGNENGGKVMKSPYMITRFQVAKDIIYLYRSILMIQVVDQHHRYGTSGAAGVAPACSTTATSTTAGGLLTALPVATRIILDSKYLIKEFKEDEDSQPPTKAMRLGVEDQEIEILCSLILRDKQKSVIPLPTLPSERLRVGKTTTIYELKRTVEKYFTGMYWGLRSMVIETVTNLNYCSNHSHQNQEIADSSVLSTVLLVHDHQQQTPRGGGGGGGGGNSGCSSRELVFEGVVDATELQAMWELNWRGIYVECVCGTKEDDGERMVGCDICEVWQHTRCARIPDNEEIPRIFLCDRCDLDINFSSSIV